MMTPSNEVRYVIYVAHSVFRRDDKSQFRPRSVACVTQHRLHAGLFQRRLNVPRRTVGDVQCLYREKPSGTRHTHRVEPRSEVLDQAAQTAPQLVTRS